MVWIFYGLNINKRGEIMKLIGLEKAVGNYKQLNAGGQYSPIYGLLMFDTETGELWTDEFCDIGHNSYKQYHKDSIVCLSSILRYHGMEVNINNVRLYIETAYKNGLFRG